jgi:ParB/RepB/Spo0J family partition protein
MQPILARAIPGGHFEIIAGERRWRASQLAGLKEVPVLVRVVEDEAALKMALIENIQRENLNPLEEAQGIHRLIQEFEHDPPDRGAVGGALPGCRVQPAAPAQPGQARPGLDDER